MYRDHHSIPPFLQSLLTSASLLFPNFFFFSSFTLLDPFLFLSPLCVSFDRSFFLSTQAKSFSYFTYLLYLLAKPVQTRPKPLEKPVRFNDGRARQQSRPPGRPGRLASAAASAAAAAAAGRAERGKKPRRRQRRRSEILTKSKSGRILSRKMSPIRPDLKWPGGSDANK